jgi:hypothetical protein
MIEDALYGYLARQAAITALIGSGDDFRLYPDLLPEGIAYPAVAYFRVSTPRLHTLDGPSGFAQPRFQFSVWGNTKSDVIAVVEALRLTLDGFRGQMGDTQVRAILSDDEMGDHDQYDGNTRSFHRVIDFHVSHEEVEGLSDGK